MELTHCPRCGQPLPEGTYLEALTAAPGRAPAYRLRHLKSPHADGTRPKNRAMCVSYIGDALSETEQENGRAT